MSQGVQQAHNTFTRILPQMPASITWISRRCLTSNSQASLSMWCLGFFSCLSIFLFDLSVFPWISSPASPFISSVFRLVFVFVISVSYFISDFISCLIIDSSVIFISNSRSFAFVPSLFVFLAESPGSSLSFPSQSVSRLFWSLFSIPHQNIYPGPPLI
jgi:hypothetical protein